MKTGLKIIILGLLLFIFTACDPSTFSDKPVENDVNQTISFGGVVVDGYIKGATVCLDANKNDTCDVNEPFTVSDENGKFSFTNKDYSAYNYVPIVAVGGVDTATNKAFQGTLKNILDTSKLSQGESLVINPLTDLVSASFLRATIQDSVSLEDSIAEVADVFDINAEDVLKDPMQDVALFAKVQEIQHLKELIYAVATKTYATDSGKDLQSEIKNALVTQIKESENGVLKLDRVLTTVELELSIMIPTNEKTFILAQITEIKRALSIFVADETMDVQNLGRLQLALENELEDSYLRLALVEDSSAIEIATINITYAFITQSVFDKTDGVSDEKACLQSNGYQMISDSSFSPDWNNDTQNGMSIISEYDFNSDVNATEVLFYYPALATEKKNELVIVFEDNYTFAFDKAWVENSEHTIYIRTPKDVNNLYGCYRTELNSTIASEIVLTKVFRYSDIL